MGFGVECSLIDMLASSDLGRLLLVSVLILLLLLGLELVLLSVVAEVMAMLVVEVLVLVLLLNINIGISATVGIGIATGIVIAKGIGIGRGCDRLLENWSKAWKMLKSMLTDFLSRLLDGCANLPHTKTKIHAEFPRHLSVRLLGFPKCFGSCP